MAPVKLHPTHHHQIHRGHKFCPDDRSSELAPVTYPKVVGIFDKDLLSFDLKKFSPPRSMLKHNSTSTPRALKGAVERQQHSFTPSPPRYRQQIEKLFQEANDLCERLSFEEAVSIWKKLALQTPAHLESAHNLGCIYELGSKDGTIRIDIEEAVHWYKLAANPENDENSGVSVGLSASQFQLGNIMRNHFGDVDSAVMYLKKAADLGEHAGAMFNLGVIADQHNNDRETATDYYRASAERGNVKAAVNLSVLLRQESELISTNNYISEQLRDESEKWLQHASAKGDSEAKFNLSIIAKERKDHVAAIKYLTEAHSCGHVSATYNLAKAKLRGDGCDVDVAAAEELLGQCADAGDLKANKDLRTLKKKQKLIKKMPLLRPSSATLSANVKALSLVREDSAQDKLTKLIEEERKMKIEAAEREREEEDEAELAEREKEALAKEEKEAEMVKRQILEKIAREERIRQIKEEKRKDQTAARDLAFKMQNRDIPPPSEHARKDQTSARDLAFKMQNRDIPPPSEHAQNVSPIPAAAVEETRNVHNQVPQKPNETAIQRVRAAKARRERMKNMEQNN